MSLNRRQLLKLGALSGVSFGIALSVVGHQWWNTPPAAPYESLSDQEAKIVMAISAAAFPAGQSIAKDPRTLLLDRYFDQLLLHMPEMQRRLLKLLLNALNSAPYLQFSTSLLSQSPAQQENQLQEWLNHSNHLFRNAVTSLVILLGMGYTAHPDISPFFSTLHQCGYGGA